MSGCWAFDVVFLDGRHSFMMLNDPFCSSIPTPLSTIRTYSSEPAASGFQVRGPNYQKDKGKVPSDESVFALLGVDNLLRKKHEATKRNSASSPDSFPHSLQATCRKHGVRTPFL